MDDDDDDNDDDDDDDVPREVVWLSYFCFLFFTHSIQIS